MLKSNSIISTFRYRGARIVFAAILICLAVSPSPARGDSGGWIQWLLDLLLADAVPQRPVLTEEDRGAIDKTKLLLADYPAGTDKFMLLGVLAAAQGDANEAENNFVEAARLGQFRSLIPLTMAAQTHLQENNVARAVAMHTDVLARIQQRPQAPLIQAINAHMDLAVAYKRLDNPAMAQEQMEHATNLIRTRSLPGVERALAYLQLGSVQKEVFQNDKAATLAWSEGSRVVRGTPGGMAEAKKMPAENLRLALELNLKVAENLADSDPNEAIMSLSSAEAIITRLPDDSRLATQVQVGEQYSKLAAAAIRQKRPDARRLSARAGRLLAPAIELPDDSPNQMILYKTTALEAARYLASARGDEVEKKEYEKKISATRNTLSMRITPPTETKIVRPIRELRPR